MSSNAVSKLEVAGGMPAIDLAPVTTTTLVENTGLGRSELGARGDFLRRVVTYVVEGHYQFAEREIHGFISNRANYPEFEERISRYRSHSLELIMAIKSKRELNDSMKLSNSKTQELREKVFAHFQELRKILMRFEQIERELKVEDLRSTIWFVGGGVLSLIGVFSVLLMQEILDGAGSAFISTTEEIFGLIVNYIFDLF